MRKKAIVLGTCVILFIGALSSRMGNYKAGTDIGEAGTQRAEYEYYYTNSPMEEQSMDEFLDGTSMPKEYIEVDTDPDSYSVLVNRTYLISKDYIPGDLVVPEIPFSFIGTYEKSYMRKQAAKSLEKLFSGAEKKGYLLKGVSAYRSYERQKQIYNNNVRNRGTARTDKVSAVPGSSEHQTGLSIDVSCSSVGCALEKSFGKTEEGKWLKENCHKYGFIIRYPKNKSKITGYSYEPWHIRYVGKNLAKHLYKNGLTLEEYYQLTTVDQKVENDPVSDTDENQPDEPQMTSAPTPKPTIVPTKRPKALYTTPTPQAEKPPVKTKKPIERATEAPKKTKAPKVTEEPQETPKPTKKPKPTKNPTVTKKPAVTKKPVEPQVTEPPQDVPSDGSGEDMQ